LTRGVGGISVAVSLAQTAFNAYMNMNPSADPALRNQFNSIVARIQDGVATAQAALDTAAQLQQPQPDVDALFASAKNTVLSLAAFLRGLRQPPGSAVDPSMASAIAHCDAVGHAHY
jgi:capsule polysaccharide export protein KpsE/RkpR